MGYNFPNNPEIGQFFKPGPVSYIWDGFVWRLSSTDDLTTIFIAIDPPGNAFHGNMWWNNEDAELYVYYDDGTSSQWVQISGVYVTEGPIGPFGPTGPIGPVSTVPGPTGPTGPIGISGEGYLRWALSDETTPIVVGNAKVTDRMPKAYTVSGIRASLNVAQASGALFTVDMKWWNGSTFVTCLSTLITFDNTETTSVSAAAQPVLSKTSFASDDLIRFDVTQIGSGSATGLKVTLFAVPT